MNPRRSHGVPMSEAFDGTAARRLTARQIYERFYTSWSPDLSARTERKYRHELNRWEKLSGDPPLADITTITYQEFRAASSACGQAAGTTETTLRLIRQLMRCAHAHGLVSVIPDRGRARRIHAPQPDPPSVEEIDALMRHTGVARWPKLHVPCKLFWRSWIAIAYWTALRREDLTWRLAFEHVRYDEDVILFRAKKTGRAHPFPMNQVVARHIRSMAPLHYAPTRKVFGPSRSPHLIQRELDRIALAARVRRVTPKCFRQAGINAWTCADPRAGEIIHGCGIPRVLSHYLDRLQILKHAEPRVIIPATMADFEEGRRQGTLF